VAKYRMTYETTLSVSLTIEADDDEAALTEDRSQGIVEEYLNTLAIGYGEFHLSADASVDGMAPERTARIQDDGSEVEIG
jgi:hypothetical protein